MTRHTTTAAISIGLPLASLTLIRSLWKLRTRSETFCVGEWVAPPPAGLGHRPGVAPEQDQHPGLVRLDDEEPPKSS